MYPCSNAFHQAVSNGNDQIPLLIFQDAVFTQEDIDVEDGIEFDDNFNMEDDVAIGQKTSNEIRFTLFNDLRLLNDYEFGEFTATIGVQTGTSTYVHTGQCRVVSPNATYIGYVQPPYLKREGVAVGSQPAFAVASLLSYDGKVYAFASDGRYAVYDDATGTNITSVSTVNAFMRNKVKGWVGKGYDYRPATRMLYIYQGGTKDEYEFVPLGVFIADRPNVPDQIRIEMRCLDRMQKFEEDMPSASDMNISYPTTIGNLFVKLCDYVGVPYRTFEFLNSGATISEEPDDFESVTMRTVIGWIAEAAASNARFDRDGYLVMDWYRTTGQSYNEADYEEFSPYWYETPQVTKLYNRTTTDSDGDTILGEGDSAYLIQDNPLLENAG